MRTFLPILFAMLTAVPALAVTVSGSGGAGPNSASRTRTVSWTNGDTADSIAIPNQCAVWRGSFFGTSAAASVYALDGDGSQAANTGTLLASFSAASAGVTTFETAYPWIKVDVTDDPASGTARLYLYCVQEAGASGSNPFAVSGGALTEASLPLIRQAKSVASLQRTGGWTTYYFSSAAGGDYPAGSTSGTGTPEEPWDATLLDNYCGTPGVMCVLDGGETFVFPGSILMDPTNCTAYPNEPCIVITTSNGQMATLTTAGTAVTAGGHSGIFGTVASSNDTGWVVIQNINCVSNAADLDAAAEADNADCFSAATTGSAGQSVKMLMFNTRATVTGDANDNCYTSHLASKQVIINGACEETAVAVINAGWVPSHISDNLAIGLDITQNTVNVGTDAVNPASSTVTGGQLDLTWIDGFIEYPDPGAGESGIEINTDADSTMNIQIARVGITGASDSSSALRVAVGTAANETVNLTFHQTTFTGMTEGLLVPTTLAATSRLTIVGNAFTCDNIADNCVNLADADWATTLAMTLTGWLYDSDDSVDVFNTAGAGAPASDTSADWQTDIDGVAHTFTVSVNNSTVNSNDAQVQWADTVTTFAKLNCNPINDCWAAYDTQYTVPFPITLPPFVFGQQVTRAVLNGTDGNIGR